MQAAVEQVSRAHQLHLVYRWKYTHSGATYQCSKWSPERILVKKEVWCWCPAATFSRSVMIGLRTVAISQLGWTELFFVAPEVMVYGTNYRDVLLIDAEHAASDQVHVGRLHRLSARHRFSTSGTGHCCVATPRDCRIDWTRTLVSKLSRPQSSWLNDLGFDTRTCLPTSIRDIDDLKQRLISVWSELKQSVVDKAIDQWRARPRACIRAKGKHFEHPTRPYIKVKKLVETCFFVACWRLQEAKLYACLGLFT